MYKTLDSVKVGYGSINAIRQVAKQTSFLKPEEEKELIIRAQKGDREACDRIVRSYLQLVLSGVWNLSGYHVNEEELIQEGCLGVLEAVYKFDVTRDVRFATLALPYIKGRMNNYILGNFGPMRIATSKDKMKVFYGLRKQMKILRRGKEQEHTWNISDVEVKIIAEKLEVPPEEVREMHNRMSSVFLPLSSSDDDEEEDFVFGLEDPHGDVSTQVSRKQHEQKCSHLIMSGLQGLKPREADIIKRRILTDDPIGLQELSQEYGVSYQRIAQIEKESLKKLKKHMESNGIYASH